MTTGRERDDCCVRVIGLVAKSAGVSADRITLTTRLLHDLGLYGDDAEEVLSKLADEFSVDFSDFHFERYFYPEGTALWLLPHFLHQKAIDRKRPITVDALVRTVLSGRWED